MAMIHDITSVTPRNKRRKRKGRGEGSATGKTAGRGTKAAHGGDEEEGTRTHGSYGTVPRR